MIETRIHRRPYTIACRVKARLRLRLRLLQPPPDAAPDGLRPR
jgi:hypothetical protein